MGKTATQPQARHAKALEVIELLDQPGEIARTIAVAVKKRLHRKLIDDRVLVPERIALATTAGHADVLHDVARLRGSASRWRAHP
jgi:hypothetical protein